MHQDWLLLAWMSIHKAASENADTICKVSRCFVSGSILPHDCTSQKCPPCVKKVIFGISKCNELNSTYTCASSYTYCPQLADSSSINATRISGTTDKNTKAAITNVITPTNKTESNISQPSNTSIKQESDNPAPSIGVPQLTDQVKKNDTSIPLEPVAATSPNSTTGITLMIAALVGAVVALIVAGVARYYWKRVHSDEEDDDSFNRSNDLSEQYHSYRQAKNSNISPKFNRDVYSPQQHRVENPSVNEHPGQRSGEIASIQSLIHPLNRPSTPSIESKRAGSTVSVEF